VQFKFDKQHGYTVVKGMYLWMIRNLVNNERCQDLRYIHALLMEPDFGLMDNIMPQVLGQFPTLFKAPGQDPDTPTLSSVLGGPNRVELFKALQTEIKELDQHGTWTVVTRESLSAKLNVLPSTWAFKIKRYPDGRLRNLKARFCARGDKQVEGINYFKKYTPVVSWTTYCLLISQSINYGWVTKQADFSNAFVQAKLKEDIYIYIFLPVLILILEMRDLKLF
jgi:hypothetical protein